MGLFDKAIKAGIAKKAIDAARKPENQQRLKGLVEKARSRRRPPPAAG